MKRLVIEMDFAGLTQTDLARRVFVAPAYISRMCRGVGNASDEILESVAKVLGWNDEPTLLLEDIKRGDVV